MIINGIEYDSINQAKSRIEIIQQEVTILIKEAQNLQSGINSMNGCNYQNSITNQPDQY